MEGRYTKALAGMRLVPQFIEANKQVVGSVSEGGGTDDFDRAEARLAALEAEHEQRRLDRAAEAANERRLARRLRWTHLWPLVKIARAKIPALTQLTAMTLPPYALPIDEFVAGAEQIAKAVEPYASLMVAAGMPKEFVAELRTDIAELRATVDAKRNHHDVRVGTTRGIHDEFTDARRELNVLDGLIRARLGERDPRGTEWAQVVRRIRRVLHNGRRSAATNEAPAPDATPTATAPAVALVVSPGGEVNQAA